MKLTRSQIIVLSVLGVLGLGVCGCLLGIIMRNAPQISQVLAPVTPESALSTTRTEEPTLCPTATATPVPTPTPTPIAPQTRYDLQVANDPGNPALRLERGYAYMALGAYAYAVEDFDTAIGLDETLTEGYLGRGEARFWLKEWSAALGDFDHALVINPELAEAHAWRGHLLSERGKHEAAVEALRQAVALDDANPWNHYTLACALLTGGNPEEARIEFTVALTLDDRFIDAYVGRAMTQAELDDFETAQADMNSALAIASYDPVVLNGQAWFYAWYRHDHLSEAEQMAQQAVADAESDLERAAYLDTLGWVYYQQGRYEEAVATLEEAASLAMVEGEVVYGDVLEHLEEARAAQ